MSSQQESARIYQFVPKVRPGQQARHDGTAAVVELMPTRLPLCDFGSGSYHDAAIQEDRSRKR
ncbi:DUF2735 domain-containing protein [Methylobacterium haplocladii]|nr:DUF2735 domain-containing protein [Methylobacterium haplocladii]